MTDIAAQLAAQFPPDRISWRLGSTNQEKTKGMALAYIDARDLMERLDSVMGMNWQCEYIPMPNGTYCCRIGLKIGEDWIWRSNGSINISDTEKADAKEMAEKGGYSDAFKRAGVLWGVGRYLYSLDSPWVNLVPAGRSYKIDPAEYPRLRALLGGNAKPQSVEKGGKKVAQADKPIPPPNDLDTWERDFRAEFTKAPSYLAAQDVFEAYRPTLTPFNKAFPQRYKALMAWLKTTGDAKPRDAA